MKAPRGTTAKNKERVQGQKGQSPLSPFIPFALFVPFFFSISIFQRLNLQFDLPQNSVTIIKVVTLITLRGRPD
jgi:hypothetical protein